MKKLLFAVAWVSINFVLGSAVLAYASSIQEDKQHLSSSPSSFSLSSQNFGFANPFQLQLQYSKHYGIYLVGQFAVPFSFKTAGAFEIDYGAKERRFNATWGHAFNNIQRFKLSAEHFSQNMEFDFQSGAVQHWVGQKAVGVTYEFLLHHKKIHDIQFNAYTSHADSDFLPAVRLKSGDTDLRHIAGADANGVGAQIDFTPSESNRLGVGVNYDRVHFNSIYEDASHHNRFGLGGTITFEQLLSRRAKLDLSLSHREIYNDYEIAFHRLLHSAPGTQLEMAIIGNRLMNYNGIPNDSRVGIDMTYGWGGPTDKSAQSQSYSLENDTISSDLISWVQKPAVRMEQVLAIKDERIIQGKLPILIIHPEPSPGWKKGDIVNQKIADADSDSSTISMRFNPNVYQKYGLALSEENKTDHHDEIWITGTVSQPTSQPESTDIDATNSSGTVQNSFVLTLGIVKEPTVTIHPEPTPPWQVGHTISQKIADIDSAESPLTSVDYSADAFKNYGLTLGEQNKTANHDEIWITGKVLQATTSTQSTSIVAKNLGGTAQGAFDLTLSDGKKPTITIHAEPTSPWAVGSDLNEKIADIDSTSQLTSVSFAADIFKDYGLTLNEKNKSDLHDEIWISGKATKATLSPQQTKITGSNASGSAEGDFSLTLADALKPVITIHNPATPWKVGIAINPFTFADIDPKSGTISKVTYNKEAFSDYGLTISEDPNTHALSVSGTPTKETPSTGVALTITATNSFQKESDPSTFTLQVLPRTKITAVLRCPLPGMPFRIRPEGGVYIDVTDDHGNPYHFVYEGGGVKAGDQVGSVDSANYEPQGTTKTFRCFVLLKDKTNFIAMDAVPVPSMPAENVKFKGDNPKQCLTGSAQASQNCPLQYDY